MPRGSSAGHHASGGIAYVKRGITYMLNIVDKAISGSFGPDERPAPVCALPGENTDELVTKLLVSAEEETDFACASANIAS